MAINTAPQSWTRDITLVNTVSLKKVKIYHAEQYRGVVWLKTTKHIKQLLDETEQKIVFYQWRAEDVPQIIDLRDTDK